MGFSRSPSLTNAHLLVYIDLKKGNEREKISIQLLCYEANRGSQYEMEGKGPSIIDHGRNRSGGLDIKKLRGGGAANSACTNSAFIELVDFHDGFVVCVCLSIPSNVKQNA